jgi:sugar (Glycoside-Pentoside-Hexuronide) transporter
MQEESAASHRLSWKERISYGLGDTGCVLGLTLVTSFLQKYYTDVLAIPAGYLTVMFLIIRIWDGVNDPILGRFFDTRRATRYGRYRQYVFFLSIPTALSLIMMFVNIKGLSLTGYLIYAYATYLLFEILYTTVNIPYGSLSAVLTADEKERSMLSIFRSIGSAVGGLPVMALGSFCYVKVILEDGTEQKVMSYPAIITGVCVFAAVIVVCCFLCFRNAREIIVKPAEPRKNELRYTFVIIKQLTKSPAFVTLCLASLFLVATSMFMNSYYFYLFDDYFGAPGLAMAFTVISNLPTVVLIFFATKLVKRYGNKLLCGAGMLVAAAAYLLLYFLKTENPYVFLALSAIGGFGAGFFLLEVWAMVNDVIDHQRVKYGKCEEASLYSFFSFTRKLGHTLAGVLSTQALVWIGYKSGENTQSAEAVKGMYDTATLVPAALTLVSGLILILLYPLSKRVIESERGKLAEVLEKAKG